MRGAPVIMAAGPQEEQVLVPPNNRKKSQRPPIAKPNETRSTPRKLRGSLLAISAAAVVSVYTIGYVSTQSSIDQLTAEPAAAASVAPASSASPAPATTGSSSASRPATTTGSSSASAATATPASVGSPYKDGTYTASGNSRHGSIEVTLVVQNGQITSASVSDCRTRYPCSDVYPLTREVVSLQKAPIHYVSGATDSSRAYTSAVSKAIAQATNAG
jgi:uncharacterized protein with FMN-binding domain